uniref:Exocyst subunit Exo70 family protein n=1 Tax=Leersia perrieri TaxID=77586 RepID=A0A0D9VK34_9ORYZ
MKLLDSIHKVHLEIKSLCRGGGGGDGTPSPADADEAAFRQRAVAAYLGLQHVTHIADAAIAPHPDTLFLLLRMYSLLADLFGFSLAAFLPILERLRVERGDSFSARFDATLLVLRTAIKTTLTVLTARISARSTKHAGSTAAGVDEITSYLLEYIKLLLNHSSLLSVILVSDNQPEQGMESLKEVVVSLISSLDASLQKKSKLYQQQQQWLFMVNNTHHVLKKAESSESEMRPLLGDGWIQKRREQLDDYIAWYISVSWEPLLSCLRTNDSDEHLGFRIPLCFGRTTTSSSSTSTRMLTRFNLEFEQTCSVHMPWKLEDAQLRNRMRGAVTGMLVPAYREFLEKHRRIPPKFIRFSPEEIKERLSELYEG